MFVQRLTFSLKPGTMVQATEMLNEGQSMLKVPHGRRIFTPYIAPRPAVVLELDFENLAELEKYWADWFALPETPAFMERWDQLIGSGTDSEVWSLVE